MVTDSEVQGDPSLRDFCEARGMSLRSRITVLEHLAETLVHAHANNGVFRRFDADSILANYCEGQLVLDLGAPDVLAASPVRGRDGVVSARDLMIASNVVFLGQVVRAILGPFAASDASLAVLCARASAVKRGDRFGSVAEIRDRLREWLNPSGAPAAPRWTWA